MIIYLVIAVIVVINVIDVAGFDFPLMKDQGII